MFLRFTCLNCGSSFRLTDAFLPFGSDPVYCPQCHRKVPKKVLDDLSNVIMGGTYGAFDIKLEDGEPMNSVNILNSACHYMRLKDRQYTLPDDVVEMMHSSEFNHAFFRAILGAFNSYHEQLHSRLLKSGIDIGELSEKWPD